MRHHFGDYPCGDALLLRAFVLTGYRNHPEVVKFIHCITGRERSDGGFLCSRPVFNENTRSCIHGSQNMLLLYSALPELWDTHSCQNLVKYFLERRIYFKRGDFSVKVKGDLRTIFPFNLRQGLLEPLYALSKMGFGKYTELDDAWHLLESKCSSEDKFILDWTPPKTYLKGGIKG